VNPIDSLLKIMVQEGATELRLASERRPQMFKGGAELPLTIPPTSTKTLQSLLGDLWSAQESELRDSGRAALRYRSAELGSFDLTLVLENDSVQVCFRRGEGGAESRAEGAGAGSKSPLTPLFQRGAMPGVASTGGENDAAVLPESMIALLTRAVSLRASDLHLSADGAPVLRIDGELRRLDPVPDLAPERLLAGAAQLERVREGRSVDRALDVAGVGRLRVNVYASDEGLCAAVRILRRDAPALADLNLPPTVERLVDLPHGLVIACGPTGCGKSSTLAALAQRILQTRARVLISLEDPIEYLIRARDAGLVRQREVGTHVRDFATGLRDALREDPDVLLIGEMRDAETISLALTAAETGHLVLASLHSRTAASAVERIVDTYPAERQKQIRVQLADALRAVISQRLIARADGEGRVPAVELLKVTYGVANLIREGRTAQIASALQAGGDEGMIPLERNLADLVRAKTITREAALAVANDTGTLSEYLRS
jgi:twitching motility protein PilT